MHLTIKRGKPSSVVTLGGERMQCVSLTDDELWRAIAENTRALSLVVEQRHELDAEMAASDDPAHRAKLMRVHLDTMNRFQREYRAYTAELRRRHAANEQSAPSKWTTKAIRRLFAKKADAEAGRSAVRLLTG
jgi:hypothetical protein